MSSARCPQPSPPHEGVGAPATLAVRAAERAVRRARSIVAALRLTDDLVTATRADESAASLELLVAGAHDPDDDVAAIAAVHALGALPAAAGGPALHALLGSERLHLREHAAWALADTTPFHPAVEPLVALVSGGGFGGMLAQRTLETWAAQAADAVRAGVVAALAAAAGAPARARLVETLGLVPGAETVVALVDVVSDPAEPDATRAAAAGALGEHPDADTPEVLRTLDTLAAESGPLAATAATALHDLGLALPPRRPGAVLGAEPARPAVVQLFLHADIDAGLSHAGQGDTGGIATLLVQLGDALVGGPGATERVVTVSRGRPADALAGLDALAAPGHHFATVPLWGPPPPAADAWPLRVAVRRGVRRVLRAARPDVIHLRMADVGSLAAAEAARELDVPVVLTLAPDPHALLAAREAAGTLRRHGFGAVDSVEHLVLRDRLLRRLADEAAHLVVFPRPELRRDLRDLLGLDVTDPSVRACVVGEGVDLAGIERAVRVVTDARAPAAPAPAALAALDDLLATLPAHRRTLPLVVSVGRLHPVKGMAALVEAWAADPALAARCNLLLVGGDLERPTREEAAELGRIAAVVPPEHAAGRGLLLAGHRPNPVVALWLAAARRGRPGLAAPGGVYTCASLKEEFGIAVLEAMSAGLVVVAPEHGGPPTYVDPGVTGVLTDTADPVALATAVRAALDLAGDRDAVARADVARAELRHRFGIGTMAAALEKVYRAVAAAAADPRDDVVALAVAATEGRAP